MHLERREGNALVRAQELARKISRSLGDLGFQGDVTTRRDGDSLMLEFEARTTKTRASSVVTRLELMVTEATCGGKFLVGKRLISENPKERSSLATWTIFVSLPIKVFGRAGTWT